MTKSLAKLLDGLTNKNWYVSLVCVKGSWVCTTQGLGSSEHHEGEGNTHLEAVIAVVHASA